MNLYSGLDTLTKCTEFLATLGVAGPYLWGCRHGRS
jgi:hypothetical protein